MMNICIDTRLTTRNGIAEACMDIIQRIAVRKGVWRPRNESGEYWTGNTVSRLWDGVIGKLTPMLQTVTKCAEKPDSYYNKSKSHCLAWRTVLESY
jgi:hypothetical protein